MRLALSVAALKTCWDMVAISRMIILASSTEQHGRVARDVYETMQTPGPGRLVELCALRCHEVLSRDRRKVDNTTSFMCVIRLGHTTGQ